MSLLKVLTSKSFHRLVIYQDKSFKDTPTSQLFLRHQPNKVNVVIEHVWLSSESFHEVLTGIKFPDQKDNQVLTKSPFIRSLEKLGSKSQNQYGVIVLENVQILSGPQRDELTSFLLDLQYGFLQIKGKKLGIPKRSLILVRVHDSLLFQTWKLSRFTLNFKNEERKTLISIKNNPLSQNSNINYKVQYIENKLIFKVINKDQNKQIQIQLSKDLFEQIKKEKNLTCLKINPNLKQLEQRIQNLHKIKLYLQKSLLYSIIQMKIDTSLFKHKYPQQGPIKHLVEFILNNIPGEKFTEVGYEIQKQLKNKLQQVWNTYSLDRVNIQELQNTISNGKTAAEILNTTFLQLINVKQMEEATQILIQKFDSQTDKINIQLNIIKLSIEKFFYRHGFIPTPQSLKILAKCHQVTQNNSLFLVLIGPTGVGKTHVPKMYSFLTQCEKKQNKLQVSDNKYASIAFHRGKDESEFHGNFTVDKEGKLSYFFDTTFKKVVQKGGVILLSQLNTVVKNREAILAWWLKQIQNTKPQANGDRVIKLQSVPTHNPQLYEIRIKKGTLIVVDINTKDYLGRASIPDHFASKNRLEIKALVTCTTDQKLIKNQIQILSKYIELFWDQKIIQLSFSQLSQLKKNQWQQQRKKRQDKYNKYAKILRSIAVSYEEGKYGKLSEQETNQGKHNKWKFSIRQVRRIIEDIRKIKQEHLHLEDFQCLYEHLGLRWKHQQDRLKVKEILSYSLERQSMDIKIDPKSFLTKNMLQNRRAIMWVQSSSQQSAYKEILKLQLEFQPKNIHCYKMSHQVGQFQLLGGEVPCKNQKDQNSKVSLGVLTNWLQKYKNSQQKLLLILQNVDKMDAGSISMLNNFLQDYQNEKLYFNGNQYQIPKNGMILMVAREEVSWSAAQNSRVVYLRYNQSKSDLILQQTKKFIFNNQLSELQNRIAPFNNQYQIDLKNSIFDTKKYIEEYFQIELKNDRVMEFLSNHVNLTSLSKNILQFIISQMNIFLKNVKERKQISEKINNNNKQLKKLQQCQQSKRLDEIKTQLKNLGSKNQTLQHQIGSLKKVLKAQDQQGKSQDELQIIKLQIKQKNNAKNLLSSKQDQLRLQKRTLQSNLKQKNKNIDENKVNIKKQNQSGQEKFKNLENTIIDIISKFQNNIKAKANKILNNVKQIGSNYQELIKYQQENGKVYLNYNDRKYQTNFTELPSKQKINQIKSKMELTPQLALVLQLSLIAFQQNRTVYLQGKAGVGKTKLTEFMAKLLNFNCSGNPSENNYFVFQMSANVQLSDLIGGFDIKYADNKRVITINRSTQLIKLIQKGGIFVLDQAAVSKQAKEVISWFSEIAQKKPGDKIILQDIPGHFTEITIHEHFHLIITGNDPKITINRKQLPKQVLDFAYKIIYPETKQKQDIIKITKKMMGNEIKIVNEKLAIQIGNLHFDISQKNKKLTTQRDILKLIKLLNKKIENIETQSIEYRKAIYFTYFAKYSQVQQYQFKFDNKFQQYFANNQNQSSNIQNFYEQLSMMSSNRIPLLINYEPLSKVQLIKNIKSKYPNIHIFKSMTSYTQQNLLGGFSSNEKGEMCFKMAGLGRFLVKNQGLINSSPPVQILICDIQLINQGVRTQLNQFLQDGQVYINNEKYYWPKNLRLIFTVPIQKIDCLSEPYQSRHLQIKYKPNNLTKSIPSIRKQAQYIDEELNPSQKLKVLNFFGEKHQKQEALNIYRRNNKDKYFKLIVSQEMEEIDWMGSLTKKKNKFGTKVLGLYKYLQVENSVIEIVGLENNNLLLNVIESLLIADWADNKFLETMVPGLDQFKICPVTLILNTNVRASKIMPLLNEWQGVKYFQITQNITVSLKRINEEFQRKMRYSLIKNQCNSNESQHHLNKNQNNSLSHLNSQKISILSEKSQQDMRVTGISQRFQSDSKIMQKIMSEDQEPKYLQNQQREMNKYIKQSYQNKKNNAKQRQDKIVFLKNATKSTEQNDNKQPIDQINNDIQKLKKRQKQYVTQYAQQQSNDMSTQQTMRIINAILNVNNQQRKKQTDLSSEEKLIKSNPKKQKEEQKQEQDQEKKMKNLVDLLKAIINLKPQMADNKLGMDDSFWLDSFWQNQGYIITVKRGQYQLNQLVYDLSVNKYKILRSNSITKIKLSMKKQHVLDEEKKTLKKQKMQEKQAENVKEISLNHFTKLLACISSLKNLQKIDLDFSRCEDLQDNQIFFLKQSLESLKRLSHFSINLAGCSKLTKQTIKHLKYLIQQKKLLTFSVNLCGTNLSQDNLMTVQKVKQQCTKFYGSYYFTIQQINQIKKDCKLPFYGLQLQITEHQTQQTFKQAFKIAALQIKGLDSLRINFWSSKIEITQDLLFYIFDFVKNQFNSLRNFSIIFFNKNKQNSKLQNLLNGLIPEQIFYDERKYFIHYMTSLLWNNNRIQYLYKKIQNAEKISKQKHNRNIFGRKSIRYLPNNQIELLLDFDEWHSLTVTDGNNKNLFEIKQFLQMKKSLIGQIDKNGGYISILIKMYKKFQLIKVSEVQYLIDKLIQSFQKNRLKENNKKFEWNQNEAITFLRMLDKSILLNNQYYWKLQSSINSFKHHFGIQNYNEGCSQFQQNQRMNIDQQRNPINTIYQKLQKIYLLAFKFFKMNSFMSKSHWLNYISGETKEKVISKSGKFSFQRFIQNKKPFYYRQGKTQGDIELSKKYERDYDDFMDAKTDLQIESLLNSNPLLIYCLKHQLLGLLIALGNQRALRCIQKTVQINKRLPSYIQSLIEDKLKKK